MREEKNALRWLNQTRGEKKNQQRFNLIKRKSLMEIEMDRLDANGTDDGRCRCRVLWLSKKKKE